PRLEELRGELDHLDQRATLLLTRIPIGRGRRQRNAGHSGEPFDGFRKADALRFHDEIEGIAMLARRKIVEEALLIVDKEGWRLFRVERRWPAPLPPLFLQAHALARHFG